MTTHSTPGSLPRVQPPGGRLRLAVLALGAGAIALAGIVAIQRAGDDATTGAPPFPATEALPASTSAAPRDITVYLTESAEQAAALERGLAVLTPGFGEPPPVEVLALAAGNAEEMAHARYIINLIEDEANGRGVRVFDVRQPGTTAQPRGGGGCEGGAGAEPADVAVC